jgi:hypothetical protein
MDSHSQLTCTLSVQSAALERGSFSDGIRPCARVVSGTQWSKSETLLGPNLSYCVEVAGLALMRYAYTFVALARPMLASSIENFIRGGNPERLRQDHWGKIVDNFVDKSINK